MQQILALKILTGNYQGSDYSYSSTDTARLPGYINPGTWLILTLPASSGCRTALAFDRRLGVGMHFGLDDKLIDPLFERWQTTYDGLLLVVQDLTTINVTQEQIVIRQTTANPLAWPPPPSKVGDSEPGKPSEGQRPSWLTKTKIDFPM